MHSRLRTGFFRSLENLIISTENLESVDYEERDLQVQIAVPYIAIFFLFNIGQILTSDWTADIEMRKRTSGVCQVISIVTIASLIFWIVPQNVEGNYGACGVSKIPKGLIVKGSGFSRGEYPWIVALIQTKFMPASFFCGGNLISSTFVITGKKIYYVNVV